ncbi:MAG: DNA-directed RNA polymerase subunit beta [Parcubacteria group bacterium GW2011_GWC1_45_9]|nr:MAG: DNA-directed RNA polymerase subunit beta [Parcubacteria group bacterium GW2011_GWA1_Parcubacteria_45_10]KKT88618.1 MAG: DNA-directed RNA polymerase subunit beta [Parcubacteria group bacterium GW2011_GWB1_45_10]KKU16484.1 MAG: DNA-directed RNA polymerase subunit beta [Parcubacteria group bacterium GW2011_GWC1_45_9]HCI05458.1 DNA-directed RNA polymerase subunit beta [Patescibacteria group bacterium]
MLAKTKVFSSIPKESLPLPKLDENQFRSFRWFIEEGIKQVFSEYSPVKDYTGKDLELHFGRYWFDEPKTSELKARRDFLTFEAPWRVLVSLVNKKTGEVKEQEIYLGEMPMMTSKGTFIVNGVERVVISQLIRSSGVYFVENASRAKKLFGAKILPGRGSWIEFDTDMAGTIGVRIDKKRRIHVTSLLRVFGLETDQEILKAFAGVDKTGYIQKTLKVDSAKDVTSAYLDVYKRLRPGEMAVFENAKSFLDAMFKRPERYDLSDVGRFKFNQRLFNENKAKNYTPQERLLDKKDLVAVVKEIIRLNTTLGAIPDDIDHLGNRRVRAVGEILRDRLIVGISRMRRTIQDRMSTIDLATSNPAQLIFPRPLINAVKDFLMTSQLSHFTEQTNPLSQLEHKRTISSLGPGGLKRERAGLEVRDVHLSHYGRICPVQTPEGQNIGLVSHFSSYSRINKLGFIETPYLKVKDGKVLTEIHWMDAYEEEKYLIAHGTVARDEKGLLTEKEVKVRKGHDILVVHLKDVEYVDASPQQLISIATGLIPFLENTDGNRALMGSNMQRQAVPCVIPQAPLVSTGFEEKAAYDSGEMVIAEGDGEVLSADASRISIRYAAPEKVERSYELKKFAITNQYTCINQKTMVKKGDKVKKGQVIADGESTENGSLALGQNMMVAFMPWGGYNFEDAIIISEKVVKEDIFSSVHIHEFTCDVRETKLGDEQTTPDIPNVSEERLKDLDEEGIVRIGAEVRENDILVGKITPRGEEELSAEEKLLRAIFGEKAKEVKDSSLRLEYGRQGRIISIKIFSRDRGDKLPPGVIKRVHVQVAELRKIMVGDKLAGRHGNKGVVSIIVPVEDMPYLADGTPIDVILNPVGVVKRMNLGQILETHLGWAAAKLGYRAITPVFSGAREKDIKEELAKAGLPESGQTTVFDGKTGEVLGDKITVGSIYLMKLNHLVEDKIHMRSIGPYSLITQQPLGGKARGGGQRFGEMEVWALEGYGAAHTLQEILTIKSDDIFGRASTYESLVKGEPIRKPNIPASFVVLVNELKGMALGVKIIGEKTLAERRAEEDKQDEA